MTTQLKMGITVLLALAAAVFLISAEELSGHQQVQTLNSQVQNNAHSSNRFTKHILAGKPGALANIATITR